MAEQVQDLTVEQVAERMQVTQESVRRWLRNKALKGYRPGGVKARKAGWRVRPQDLETFIGQRLQESA